MRSYLAPLGVTVGGSLRADRVVIDADDDDAALFDSLGEHDDAVDAASLEERAGLDAVTVVPNAVDVPAAVPSAPDANRLLFLGNLTYAPNRDAARWLATEILPRVRDRRPDASVELVGRSDGSLDDLANVPGVHLTGAVPHVAPHYASADVVVVALRHSSGTRIKVLEAFAHRRPVIATRAAVAGLDVEDGTHVVVADTAEDLATAIDSVLADPDRARAMTACAAELVDTSYSRAAVAPIVRDAVLGVRASA